MNFGPIQAGVYILQLKPLFSLMVKTRVPLFPHFISMVKTKKHTFDKHIISSDRFFPQRPLFHHILTTFFQQSAELHRHKLKNIYPWIQAH